MSDPRGAHPSLNSHAHLPRSEVLFIGGRSGSGKSSAALALHSLLTRLQIEHCVLEGDYLDLAFPAPWEHRLAEKNLADVWRNYRALGYRRLVYTNTVSVLQTGELASAMGDDPRVHSALLTASDAEVHRRLSGRESGDEVARHVERSLAAAARLEREAPAGTRRIDTEARSPEQVAAMLLEVTGWSRSAGLGPRAG